MFVALSGPSGVGKDTIIEALKKRGFPLHFIVTATTRPRRESEKEGVDYYFLPESLFKKMIGESKFLEWAQVYEHYYGIPRSEVQEALARGKDSIVRVDVQGAATLRKVATEALLIFLAPPSLEVLAERLKERASESRESISLRLEKARSEMEQLQLFDYVVINDKSLLDRAVNEIEAIITAEKCRTKPREIRINT